MTSALNSGFEGFSLEVSRGNQCLFTDLSFRLERGEMALVTGANGCGKTSLLRVLAGLAAPNSGRVMLGKADIHGLLPEQRRDLVFKGHLNGLKKELTARENMEFFCRLWQGSHQVDTVLAELQLSRAADYLVRYLSTGQRRRASLGALRLQPATLWILDEPLAGLDKSGIDLICGWVREHLQEGGIVVIATHQTQPFSGSYQLNIEL